MKMPPTTIPNSSQANKSSLTVAKPSLPQVNPMYYDTIDLFFVEF